jgi:phosphate transport system substrate-binding protein
VRRNSCWRSSVRGVALIALIATALACGREPSEQGGGSINPPDPPNKAALARLRGDIVVDGSSTVYPISAAAAEEFQRFANRVRISVGVSGTGGGFKKFCSGETDIANASRPIRPTEAEACRAKGIEFIELPVAFDGLAVVVHPQNTWAECLTREELKQLWQPQAQGRVGNWRQIRSTFPDRSLRLFGPGTDSGTFDYFTEAIVGTEKASRGDFQASEDDNVLVTGVGSDPGALGYFGYAYVVENATKLRAVAIDATGDGTCVQPSFETIGNGTYQPLSRPLFIYIRRSAAERPEVRAFIQFYLSSSYTPLIASREVGYVVLPDAVYAAALRRFDALVAGTLWPKGAEVGATLDRYLD